MAQTNTDKIESLGTAVARVEVSLEYLIELCNKLDTQSEKIEDHLARLNGSVLKHSMEIEHLKDSQELNQKTTYDYKLVFYAALLALVSSGVTIGLERLMG